MKKTELSELFNIEKPDQKIKETIINHINNLSKPKGSLGRLEELALNISLIQQTTSPRLNNPQNVIFAADHGIADEGVSASPKEVTTQVIFNLLKGGQGINFLTKQHNFKLKIIDSGVDFDFPKELNIMHLKVRKGTRNYLFESALTNHELIECFNKGIKVIDLCQSEGTNIISFGEMGIGNTSTSAIWMNLLTNIDLNKCVGAGSGLDLEGISHKYNVLNKAINSYTGDKDVTSILTYFGALEMNMAVSAMLRAAQHKMIILVDGFIMTNVALAASKINEKVLDYCIFTHQGDESGHKLLLEYLKADPILHLNLRLGEGSGAVCAFPIIDSAVRMMNEMISFNEAGVTKYF